MKKFLKKIFGPLLTRLASHASAPDRVEVFKSLGELFQNLKDNKGKRGVTLDIDLYENKFIVFSDHHKGDKGAGDDFVTNEKNYLAALDYYYTNKFYYVNLGDSEELWKYKPGAVISKNVQALQSEARFHHQKKYFKTFGNHDLAWKNTMEVEKWFDGIYALPLPVYEGLLLRTNIAKKTLSIFLTHGHQGDKMSDNNAFSTWLVSHIWRPIQRYLNLNINTPAKDFVLRDKHNIMMYEWSSAKKDLLLITGHTHKPVFAAGLYSTHPNNIIYENQEEASTGLRPTYFNSGCCCYNDGDLTGIEIGDGKISLVKWHWDDNSSARTVLEEVQLEKLVRDLDEIPLAKHTA